MNQSKFRIYTGKELLEMSNIKRPYLIEGFLKEKDSVILVGEEKSGKSICTFQQCMALTSGSPFLGQFKVQKELKVVYVQLEGEIEDSSDRLTRMNKVLDFNPDNFQLYYTGAMDLQDPAEALVFAEKFEEFNPDVIFVDPIYFAFSGDLNDNTVVRAFTSNIRAIKNKLQCAIVLVHHTHRTKYTHKGDIIDQGDEAIFGSKFFKAWADHTLFFSYDKKNQMRILSCSTQRSGDVNEKVKLRLVQPDPLYFEVIDTNPSLAIKILDIIKGHSQGALFKEIKEETTLADSTIYKGIGELITNGLVEKSKTRPVVYIYKG